MQGQIHEALSEAPTTPPPLPPLHQSSDHNQSYCDAASSSNMSEVDAASERSETPGGEGRQQQQDLQAYYAGVMHNLWQQQGAKNPQGQ